MKILHIITRLILGGAQKNTVMSCAAQVAAGHEVALAYGPIYGPEGSLLEDAKASGATLHEIPSMRRSIQPHKDVACYFALRKLIREFKPDVVHTHSSKAGVIGRAAAWKENVPAVIHTIHGLPFHERQSKLVHGIYVAAERYAAKRCHKLVGITQAMCDAFEQHGIGRREQFAVIPSGVEVDKWQPSDTPRDVTRRAYGIPEAAPVIGLLARLDPLKGQDDLIDILPDLLERYPETRLLFVGDGFHREHLEQRVEQGGFDEHVIFAGLVPPMQVPSLLAAMDVNTLPSYQEGQSRTLVESLLCECPIVAYAAGGIPEVCIEGKTGKLAAVGNRSELRDAILWMLDHPAERERLTRDGRAYVAEHFSVKRMVTLLEQLYEQSVTDAHVR